MLPNRLPVVKGWYIDKSRFDFHIDPVLNQSVGGPENFYMYQLGAMATADLWVTDHLLTTGSRLPVVNRWSVTHRSAVAIAPS